MMASTSGTTAPPWPPKTCVTPADTRAWTRNSAPVNVRVLLSFVTIMSDGTSPAVAASLPFVISVECPFSAFCSSVQLLLFCFRLVAGTRGFHKSARSFEINVRAANQLCAFKSNPIVMLCHVLSISGGSWQGTRNLPFITSSYFVHAADRRSSPRSAMFGDENGELHVVRWLDSSFRAILQYRQMETAMPFAFHG